MSPPGQGRAPESPEVTVVIPTHNRWHLAHNAITIALGQRDVSAEVIVVDDGSSDETPLRLRELDDPRLRAFRHDSPAGVARARNRGIAEARGGWVAFLDDDDVWAPHKLRAQLDAASAAGASFVWTGTLVLDERRRVIRTGAAAEPGDLAKRLLVNCVIGGPSSVMVRTELLRQLGGFDERFSAVADWDLWIRLSRVSIGAACPEPLVGFLQHSSNMLVSDTDPNRARPEFNRLAAKHRVAANAQGAEFGWAWIDRWVASRHRLAGRPVSAARTYLASARRHRDAGSLIRAAGALLPKQMWELAVRAHRAPPRQLHWLEVQHPVDSGGSIAAGKQDDGRLEARITVIVASFNERELVAEAVASVREREPVEIVVVDDGSDDPQALEQLDQLRSAGVNVVRRANGGPPAARNTGLEMSSTPFVYALDSDDLLEPGVLGHLADLLERHPRAGFAWGDYLEFGDHAGRSRAPARFLPWSITYVNLYSPGVMLRRSAAREVGGWQDPRGYEDWGLLLAFAERGIDGVSTDRVVYRRRIHGSSRVLPAARRQHRAKYADLKRRYPGAFANRRDAARRERPPLFKRVLYPLLFGSRPVIPPDLEDWLRRTRLWGRLRVMRR